MFGAGRTERCGPLWMDGVRCWCVMISPIWIATGCVMFPPWVMFSSRVMMSPWVMFSPRVMIPPRSSSHTFLTNMFRHVVRHDVPHQHGASNKRTSFEVLIFSSKMIFC